MVMTNDEEISERVAAIFPEPISDFFLFDGEAIQAYTDPRSGGERVREALERLLGIHLYKQMAGDLDQVIKAIRDDREKVDVTSELNEKQGRREHIEVELRKIGQRRQQLRRHGADVDARLRELNVQQDRIAAILDPESQARRHDLETSRARVEEDLEWHRSRAAELLTEAFPVALFIPELSQAKREVDRSQSRLEFPRTAAELADFIWDNRAAIAEACSNDVGKEGLHGLITKLLFGQDVRPEIAQALADASWLVDVMLPKLNELASAEDRQRNLMDELQRIYAELNTMPSLDSQDADLQALLREIEQKNREKAKVEYEIASLAKEENRLRQEADELDRLLPKLQESYGMYGRYSKQIYLCQRTQEMLDEFIAELTDAKVGELESLVTKCFRRLTNIPTAIERVEVDRGDYRLTIKFREAGVLEADLTSAGQKEVLAFALIWSLVHLASHDLPVLVDTPLGRLDSIHRRNVLREFFPRLGGQVIILATDEEIGREELISLGPHIASKHRIVYDEQTKTSSLVEGYLVD